MARGRVETESFFSTSLSLAGNSGRLTCMGKAQQLQEHNYPFLSVCVVFSCAQVIVWRPVFRISNVGTDTDECDCTRGLYGHRQRVCTGS